MLPSTSSFSPDDENWAATKCQAPLFTVAVLTSWASVEPLWTPKATNPDGSTHSIRSWLVEPVSGWTLEKPMNPPPVVEEVLTQPAIVKVDGEVSEVMVPT